MKSHNDPVQWRDRLPWPTDETHKHMRGRLGVVSGGVLSTGAARLAARAGLRIGAGVVKALAEKTELELKKAADAELAGEAEEIPPLAASPVPAEPIEEITETISEDEAGGEKQ